MSGSGLFTALKFSGVAAVLRLFTMKGMD